MAVPRLTDDLDIIQKLSDNPNDTDGLSAAELKARFDAAVNIIKVFLNGNLAAALDAIEENAAKLSGKEITNVLGIDNNTIPTSAAVRASLSSSGAGDMASATYDVDGKREDIFRYADNTVGSHNNSDAAHGDIRDLLKDLSERINAVLDSDDETLDELSEIVAYIKSNRDLLEAVTTAKVSVVDIINNLTTNVATKPLSAAQGVVLKTLIDGITPTGIGALPLSGGTLTGILTNTANYIRDTSSGGEGQYAILNDGKGTYKHNCKIYGGNPGSETAFGMYDTQNARRILTYLDTRNLIYLGGGGTARLILDAGMYGEEGTEPSNPANGQLYITLL